MDNLWEFLKTRWWWGHLICALFSGRLRLSSIVTSEGRVRLSASLARFDPLRGARQVGLGLPLGFLGALFTFVSFWNFVVRILHSKSDDE